MKRIVIFLAVFTLTSSLFSKENSNWYKGIGFGVGLASLSSSTNGHIGGRIGYITPFLKTDKHHIRVEVMTRIHLKYVKGTDKYEMEQSAHFEINQYQNIDIVSHFELGKYILSPHPITLQDSELGALKLSSKMLLPRVSLGYKLNKSIIEITLGIRESNQLVTLTYNW
tara:strand:+ start:937 stop:1443 length:507 start_codon:yes stop_codon:yes gene_type:complete